MTETKVKVWMHFSILQDQKEPLPTAVPKETPHLTVLLCHQDTGMIPVMPWERHPDTVDVMGKVPTQRDQKYLLDLRHRDSRRIQMIVP